MIKSTYNPFLFQLLTKLLSLFGVSFDCIFKFATHHPHFKDKLVGNPIRTFVCDANCLYFLCAWNNLSAAYFLTYNGGTFIVEPGLVTTKGEPPRTFLHLFFLPDQPLSLLFGLTSKNAPSDVFILGKSKYATICKWPFSSAIYQIQQSTNEKGKQASTEQTSRKQARFKKGNTEEASTSIYQSQKELPMSLYVILEYNIGNVILDL